MRVLTSKYPILIGVALVEQVCCVYETIMSVTMLEACMASTYRDQIADEGGGEGQPLSVLFGSPARVRIIEAFVAERGRDLSVSDVARLSDVARSTVYRHLEDLEELGVIAHMRDTQAGHSARYQLNDDSEISELLFKLEGVTLRRLLELDGQLGE